MKKLHKLLLVLLFFALLIVCFPKLWTNDETEIYLGKGYYFIPFQEITFDVTGFGGNGIYVYRDKLLVPIVFSEVVDYEYDSLYIIVKQDFDKNTKYLIESMIFLPDVYYKYMKGLVMLEEKHVNFGRQGINSIRSEEYINRIMQEDKYIKKMRDNDINYYIINKRFAKTFGPLQYEEFETLRQKMGVDIHF